MRTEIIAEIASCHNGDLELAKALIKAAAGNGADIVKFQDWKAANVPNSDSDKKRYERYQFPDEWYSILIPFCKEHGVEFLTSCYNADRVEYLASLGLKKIKIASVSAFNQDLIIKAGAYFDELIVSTGMRSLEEIEELADLLATNAKSFTIMHCVADYPTIMPNANLQRIDELKKLVSEMEYASVGFSDHSLEPEIPKMAMSKGIKYLEKHFSLSRYLPQIPHQMFEGGKLLTTHEISISPRDLRELSDWGVWVDLAHGGRTNDSIERENLIKQRYLNRYGT